jgi:hypothetical protein
VSAPLTDLIAGGWARADLDPARLHRLGHDALESYAQQAILEAGVACLDEAGELEPAIS